MDIIEAEKIIIEEEAEGIITPKEFMDSWNESMSFICFSFDVLNLFNKGWRLKDRKALSVKYNLSDEEIDKICKILEILEEED